MDLAHLLREAAKEYELTLEELTTNNKTQINLLTILAEDYVECGSAIVDTIYQKLFRAPRDMQMPLMYVTDSILKNVRGRYLELFGEKIVEMFMYTFKKCIEYRDDRSKVALYRLRATWGDVFTREKLYELDRAVKRVDREWPMAESQKANTNGYHDPPAPPKKVHVNPKFILLDKQENEKSAKSSHTARTQEKPVTSVTTTSRPDPRARKTTSTTASNNRSGRNSESDKKPVVVKTEILDELLNLPPVIPVPIKEEIDDLIPPPRSSLGKRKGEESPIDPKKRRSPQPPRIADQDHRFNNNHHASLPPLPNSGNHHTIANQVHKKTKPVFTGTAGAHAFSSLPSMPPATSAYSSPPPPVIMDPAPQDGRGGHLPIPSTVFSQQQLLNPPFATQAFMPSGMFPPPPNAAPTMTAQAASIAAGYGVFPQTSTPPPPFATAPPQAAVPPAAPVIITHENEQVKLEGIPANNRIFVDGKAHEVMFIEDVAVIERNGLPHRIYFSGAPRNIMIDDVAHQMSFNEPKTVLLHGVPHVLRFGAPSRELYMGKHPFKGQFGGPPIIATIGGHRHTIRLCGPAPEVKIEPDPSYDLARFLAAARSDAPPERMPAPEQQVDPFSLLKKLQQSGFLRNQPVATAAPKKSTRDATPPIPSETTMDVSERRSVAPANLKDFNMRLLKIRYTDVVDSIHEKQAKACPHCGMRMELKGEKYERHLDWHVRRNLRTEKANQHRPWYNASKNWLKSEEEDEAGVSGANAAGEDARPSVPAISSNETEVKECCVCGEKFEEYFDEDDDIWKLRDCVKQGNRVFHHGCEQDMTMAVDSSHLPDEGTESEADCDNKLSVLSDIKLLNTCKIGE